MTVKVLELCTECNVLKEGVETREHMPYYNVPGFKLHSCEACFESEKDRRVAEAYEGYC